MMKSVRASGDEKVQKRLRSQLYSYAENSSLFQATKHQQCDQSQTSEDMVETTEVRFSLPHKPVFRTTFFKTDHDRKIERVNRKAREKLPPLHVSPPLPDKDHESAEDDSDQSSVKSVKSNWSISSSKLDEVVWENVVSFVPKTEEMTHVYDIQRPSDSDVINHIVRLRDALQWRTMLPRHGPGVRHAMKFTNHKNPLKETLNMKKDPGEFVYAVAKPQKPPYFNPFALHVVSANQARCKQTFYIVSATSVTKCVRHGEDIDSDIYPVIWWLYEQRLYNMVCNLPVFTKFRIWKQFNVWKNNIRGCKTANARAKIGRHLFVVDSFLQSCILHVRRTCEDMCGSNDGLGVGENAICLLKYDSRRTYDLEEFCEDQESVLRISIDALKKYRNHVVMLAESTCTVFAEHVGITKDIRKGKVTCRLFPPNTDATITDTTYTQLAAWRKDLSRLASFIHLLDQLIQEMLNRMIVKSMRYFLSFLSVSNREGRCEIDESDEDYNDALQKANLFSEVTRHSDRNGYGTLKETTDSKKVIKPDVVVIEEFKSENEEVEEEKRFYLAIFNVRLVLEVSEAEAASVVTSNANSSIKKVNNRGVIRRASVVRFGKNILHPGRSVDSLDSEYDDDSVGSSRRQSIISEQSLQESPSVVALSPTRSEFKTAVKRVVEGLESVLEAVHLIRTAEELQDFIKPPAFDIHLSSLQDEVEERCVFGCDVVAKDSNHQRAIKKIFQHLNAAIDQTADYSINYDRYCSMVDDSRLVDVDGALNQQEWTPDEFAALLFKHTEMTKEIREMRTSKRVSLFHVDAKGFAKSSLPFPQAVVDAAHRWLPVLTTRHNEELLAVVRKATLRLDSNPDTVELFVDHLTFLARTSTEMPALEKEYLIVTRFFKIIKDYGVWLDPEQLAIFHTLVPAFQHLKTTILFCEAKKDENISRFSTDLDKHIHNLRYQLFDLKNKVAAPKLLSGESLSVAALEAVKLLADDAERLVSKARSYANYQDRFGSSYSSRKSKKLYTVEALIAEASGSGVSAAQLQAELSEVERDITLRKLLWESSDEWVKLQQDWKDTEFAQLDTDNLQGNVSRFMQTVFMLEKGLPRNDIVPKLKESVLDFKQNMPLIAALRNTCLKQSHWDEIQYAIGRSLTRDSTLTLGDLLKWRLFQHRDLIMEISTRATNEATLQAMLNKLTQQWHSTDFKLVAHVSGTQQSVMIVSTAEEIWSQLEESQITIATIKGSRYVTPIKTHVDDWERRLMLFSRTLDEWMTCQRNWLYLEPVFTTIDIQRQLPQESQLFTQVDHAWRDLMRRTEDRPNALRAATGAGVLEGLQSANSNLEKIQKCLEDYLEVKRLAFSRFYFLSNDELLSILSHGREPSSVQPHLVKCFANIKYLDIRTGSSKQSTVHSMISAEGEVVNMPKNVKARGSVEQWLSSVESAMFETVRKHLRMALLSWSFLPENLVLWMFQHPGQVVLTVAQIMFNKDVTNAFQTSLVMVELKRIHGEFLQALNVLSEAVSRQRVVAHQYFTLEALIIIYVHIRDIIASLIACDVSSVDNFEWSRQLLYEWQDASNMCRVVQADARFSYGCEYIGCASRLVITPLTDRCFLTLTGALNLHLGGSPAGPAGTGKSETVKDLAKILGKQCVVFNCSEGIDFKMMGQFFSGLSQSGSWCCFDEFNRIDVEVLSVIASQVHAIKSAKDAQALRFLFEGRDIKLNASCAYFITMNPGYRGRVELPDNLKSLFRPVAMMVPDYALITEIILFSEGFREAKLFSRKVVNLYELASKQLSQQDHYDFGMRSIKSVLVMAGHKKREVIADHGAMTDEMIAEQERSILIHSLKNANLPRFLAEDAPLFRNIMSDLFPGVTPPTMGNATLEKCIKSTISEMLLEKWPDQIQKVIQLNEQLAVRHGVMLVGPSGGGKTTVRNLLQRALTTMYNTMAAPSDDARITRRRKFIDSFTINPKCISLGELYGFTDPNTLEWADGLLAFIVRKYAKELSNSDFITGAGRRPKTSVSFQESMTSRDTPASMTSERSSLKTTKGEDTEAEWRWVILDGPVDTAWVENLNTALDDTKTLCLANGERIGLPNNMRLVFEVDTLAKENLQNGLIACPACPVVQRVLKASPATISRCAMVYFDPVDLGWKPYVRSWIDKLPDELPQSGRDHLWGLFELSMDAGLQLLDRRIKLQHLPVPHLCIVQSLCRILSSLFKFMEKNGGFGQPDKEEKENDENSKPSSNIQTRPSSQKLDKRPPPPAAAKKTGSERWFMQAHPDRLTVLLGKLFVFAFTWSVGGVLNREDDQEDDTLISSSVIGRDEALINMSYDFDHFVHDTFESNSSLGVQFPSGNRSVFSYFVDLQTGRFSTWDGLVPNTRILIERGLTYTLVGRGGKGLMSDHRKSAAADTAAVLVPTTDTIRYSFLTSLLLLNNYPVLLTGESGVGKTALLQNMLSKLSELGGSGTESGTILGDIFRAAEKTSAILQNIASLGILDQNEDGGIGDEMTGKMPQHGIATKEKTGDLIVNTIQFSALTQPSQCQNQILSKLGKRSKHGVGPPRGKKCIAFINDLNMPSSDEHGTQPPLELIRQFLDLNGFYDVKRLTWKSVFDVTIGATAAPPVGGRSMISERVLKHFSVLSIPQPSTKSLQHIYQVQLGHFLENGDFMPEVKESCHQVVNAAIAVYYKMCNAMLPTPNKSHYTFNLRDLSAVIKGILQADESVIVSRETTAQLFAHEATRVFHDRLTDADDRKVFYDFLSDDLHNYFKITIPSETLYTKPFIFGDFTDLNAPTSTRAYRQLPNHEMLSNMLEEYYMRISGSSVNAAHLVFFEAAVNHVIRASRVFRQPSSHMLLVGIDGTGKSTTCKLAAKISGCKLYKLSIVRGYSLTDFRDELKKVMKLCGVTNLPTVFLLTDADLVSESFLEDINCLLNTGEDAELFDHDELDTIVMEVKQDAIAKDVADSRSAMLNFFRRRIARNLHIAIATSPAGGAFRRRCRSHPALVNCCTIDWYDRWPKEALMSVARSYLSRDNVDILSHDGEDGAHQQTTSVEDVSPLCVRIHFSAAEASERLWDEMRRRYYTTPTTYLEFVQLFTKMLEKNKKDFQNALRRLLTGLHKLAEARSLVNVMQQELIGLGPKIEQKAKDTERLMIQLKKDTDAVNEVREIVRLEESTMRKETQLVQDFAQQATVDLQAVLPALQEAVMALDALDKSDIAELRVYKNPPQLVLTVMNAVCILLQVKAEWISAKQLLADPHFLKKLVQLDRDAIPTKAFNKLRRLTNTSEFSIERVADVSVACKSMCMWVLALQHYNDVKTMVEPKQRRVQEAKEALEVAQENLRVKQESLTKIQEHLTKLKKKHEDSLLQQVALKERKVVTGKRLQRAAVLIGALVDEEGRWKDAVDRLKNKLSGLIGDTVVSAASVAYLGPFIRSYRDRLTSSWLSSCQEFNVHTSPHYDVIKLMGDDNQIREWHNQGLPRDVQSTVNSVIIHAARRWPLIIDPQGQATNWIKQMEKDSLHVVHAGDPNYMKNVENAIRVGETLLLCDVGETLDPELRPVLQRELTRRAGQDYITIGGTEISYNDSFRLYMTTSRANPHFLPAVCIAVTLVNFTVTFEGLQGQLLSSVVTHERPQLEEQRGELLRTIAEDLKLLQELEDKALMLLETQQGHILDDVDLISTLKQSKVTSAEVMDRLKLSEENELKTEAARGRYLPVATRGAVLYFVLADLEVLNSMYQFSLQWFMDKFIECVEQAHDEAVSTPTSGADTENSAQDLNIMEESLGEMLQKMIDILTQGVYKVVSYTLFGEHQIVFSFLLTTAIMRNNSRHQDKWGGLGELSDLYWNVFLHTRALASMTEEDILVKQDGRTPMDRLEEKMGVSKSSGPPLSWIDGDTWKQCQYASLKISSFKNLCESFAASPALWDSFSTDSDPFHLMAITCPRHEFFNWSTLTTFERLLLIKILRPECLLHSVRSFVRDEMGEIFVQNESFNLNEIYSISKSTVPLIFILSPGTDPSAQLLRYAKEMRGSALHVDMVSLGRGQGPKAEDLINKAQILKGRWVFLQNCHLAASFMPRLQTMVEELARPGSDIDSEFRLWLSSKPDPSFPLPILQNGLKMAVEPPRGIRAHLQLAFGSAGSGEVTPKLYDEGSQHKAWRPLLFALCCFNALAHERRRFGTLGFNLSYDFTSSDLEVSILMLKQLLGDDNPVPWSALRHLAGLRKLYKPTTDSKRGVVSNSCIGNVSLVLSVPGNVDGEVVYGGRVTDNWDRRCLVSSLSKFYSDVSLKEGHAYSRDGVFRPPHPDATFAQVREYINSLPLSDPPDVFGMHDNAERAYRESEAEKLVDFIIQVQPKLATASVLESGKTDSEIVSELTRDMLRRLPLNVENDESVEEHEEQLTLARLMTSQAWKNVLTKAEKQDSARPVRLPLMQSALLTVARQEIDRFNKLLGIIQVDLRMLTRAMEGEIVMSESLEQTFNALLLQKVPASWQAMSYESCKLLGSWLEDLLERIDFFASWSHLVISSVQAKIGISRSKEHIPSQKRSDSLITEHEEPISYWLSAFFFPQGFLTGVLQNYARKYKVPVDVLSFQFHVQSTSSDTSTDTNATLRVKDTAFRRDESPLADGVRVFGLFLDSARWGMDNALVDCLPSIRYFRMPEIHFIPARNDAKAKEAECYECPLYRTSVRAGTLSSTGHSTNFVGTVALKSNHPSDYWILRGTALLCQLDH